MIKGRFRSAGELAGESSRDLLAFGSFWGEFLLERAHRGILERRALGVGRAV